MPARTVLSCFQVMGGNGLSHSTVFSAALAQGSFSIQVSGSQATNASNVLSRWRKGTGGTRFYIARMACSSRISTFFLQYTSVGSAAGLHVAAVARKQATQILT